MEPRIQYAKTSDGVSIAYWAIGDGRPLVWMLTPPWGHIQLEWQWPELRACYERLAERTRLIRYNGRGGGLSDRKISDFSLEAHIRDLEAVVDRLQLERFALFALGDAGPVAVSYAVRHPQRVSELVLWGTYAKGGFGDESEIQALYALIDADWRLFVDALVHRVFGWSAGDYGYRYAELILQSTTAEAVKAAWSASFEFDVTALLPQVRAPTLVLHPSQHPWANAEDTRCLTSEIPDARLVVLEGPSGVFWWQEPVISAIEQFFDEHEPHLPPTTGDLPRGTAVILFADIVDSTGLTERMGDAAFREKARELDAALRGIIRENGGTPVEGKLLGDGVLAVFTSAREAIEAALRCGAAGSRGGLPLHLGIHAGDVIREEGNVYGGAVNIASRIAGLSAAGEVLVSETVRSLARTSAGVRFEERGERELKGIGEPVRVWAVRSPSTELRTGFDSPSATASGGSG